MVGKIVVAGDVTIDWLQWAIKPKNVDEYSANWQVYPGFKKVALGGGAILLDRMVKSSLSDAEIEVFSYDITNLEQKSSDDVIHSVSTLNGYKSKDDIKWRVCDFIGFSGPENGFPDSLILENDQEDANIVILDDAGNGFREDESKWPSAMERDEEKPTVILKMCRPLLQGKLWKKLQSEYDDNLVVVISANDLRDHGVKISRKLSWEQTAEDFIYELQKNPEIYKLRNCKHLIVRFGIEGVIHYHEDKGKPKVTLFYDSKSYEDKYREDTKGDMQGFGCIFVAALSAYIARYGLDKIPEGAIDGLKRCRLLLDAGFIKSNNEMDYPVDIFQKSCSQNIYCVPVPSEKDPENRWTIIESIDDLNIESLAFHYVLKGDNVYLDMVPMGRFGGLNTIDRNEIEGYQSIRNLMEEYLSKETADKPLSIAVFGPPGSGKSFGVVQLAESISKAKIKKMEFNVSQFQSPADLINAFQKVRDVALKGTIPLVFFDEFDSSMGKDKLPWLKYFLAPMQDGEFKDGEDVHPIGKSIFVFAGGTSSSFQDFSRENKDENSRNEFRDVKGTDFVSRLRGYVNIIGPDPVGDEKFFIMRRALLLRSLLKNSAPHIIDSGKIRIDPGVLFAFLQIGQYKHGVRSMQAIIDMSQLNSRKKYEQSALPSKEQLKMHVDADEFYELVTEKSTFYSALERMAKMIHANYRKMNPDFPTWGNLTEDYKDSNRLQAENIPVKLKKIKYEMRRESEPENSEFDESEIEILAILEHERWMQEKRLNGWRLGERNDKKKTHPDLISWKELSEDSKEYDRDAVRNIPKILAEAGFGLYKLSEK